jgi:hypothetical protein
MTSRRGPDHDAGAYELNRDVDSDAVVVNLAVGLFWLRRRHIDDR